MWCLRHVLRWWMRRTLLRYLVAGGSARGRFGGLQPLEERLQPLLLRLDTVDLGRGRRFRACGVRAEALVPIHTIEQAIILRGQ